MNTEKTISITILLPAGRLPLDIMDKAQKLAVEYNFGIYLSTAQNLRLIDVPESVSDKVKEELKNLGAVFKGPGKFPLPRVCIGKGHCNLGLSNTEEISSKILEKFSTREKTKAKFKIAVSGCAMCCSSPKTTDFGIITTQKGFDLYVGGKGGLHPKVGIRIAKNADLDKIIGIIEVLVEFHDKKTTKKQRIYKLLDDPQFPFTEI